MSTLLHPFQSPVEHIELPGRFTNPFHYEPHPLCVLAAEEVQAYLATRHDWADELRQGKMFGVLVVRTAGGGLPGYLEAFSGLLAGKSVHPFFVPPVYDLQRPGGFFKPEASAKNKRAKRLCANGNASPAGSWPKPKPAAMPAAKPPRLPVQKKRR